MEEKASHDDQPAKVETLLTTEQAAWLLRISHKTLERMRVESRGPKFVKIGRCVRSPTRPAHLDQHQHPPIHIGVFTPFTPLNYEGPHSA